MKAGGWVALTALIVFPFATDNFELPKQLVLAAACLALGTGHPWNSPDRKLLWGWLGVAAVATLFSQAPMLSLVGVADSRGGLVSVAIFAAWYLAVRARADTVAAGACLAVWPVTAWAWLQRSGHDLLQWSSEASWCGELRPFASLGHPAQLGVFCALVLPLALERAWKHWSWFAALTAVAAVATCGVSLSRAGWLAAAVGTGVWLLLRPARGWVLGAAALAAVGLAILRPAGLSVRVAELFTAPTRVHLWQTALDAWRERPVLGFGLDTFQLASQRYRPPEAWLFEWGTTPQHAHALVPQVLATMGSVGGAMLAVSAGVLLLGLLRLRRSTAAELPAGALGAMSGFLSAWMVSFHGAAVLALGLACVAEVARFAWPAPNLAETRPDSGHDSTQYAPGSRSWPLTLTAAGLLLIFPVRWLGASIAGRSGNFTLASRLEPENAAWPALEGSAQEAAYELSGDQAARERALAAYEEAERITPQLAIYLANVGRAAALSKLPSARTRFEAALALAPNDGRILHQAALAERSLGDAAAERGRLSRLLTLYPGYGPGWWELAQLELSQQHLPEGRAMLQAALQADWRDWPAGEAVAQTRLAQLLASEGELEQAREVTQVPAARPVPEACGAPRKIELAPR